MELEKTGLDSRVFTAFSETSRRRYIYLCNMQTNISRWSKSAVDYFGLPGEYMEKADEIWESYIHPDDREVYRRDIEAVFSGKKKYHELEYRVRNREGNYVICTCKGVILYGENGEPDLFAGTLSNHGIISNIDATTNLYNIYEFLNAVRQIGKTGEPTTLLMIGINQFRAVNDIYDYAFGNEVLREFASRLMELVHGRGLVYRMDGTKFALRIHMIGMDELRSLYAQIQEIGRRQITVDGKHIPLSISGGAMQLKSLCAQDYSIRSCLAYAQEKSKQEHHSQLVIFDNELEHKKLKSLEVLETIRQSVLGGCDGFYLCYQPIVNPDTAKTVGMEALLRFCKEPYGEIMPGQFIEWLEQDECFFELGNWILRRALTDGLEFVRRDPDFKVNVNVSYSQLDRGDFLESLLAILEETGFPPENLYIELTERCQISDLNRLKETLDFFGTYGIRIALDDFGTGTASLNLLRSLPIGCLKIDHTFLANIETNERDRVIVDLIINSANRLGMSVCLEGVENEKICAYVKRYKAVVHQGYYYSRPVRLEAFRQYVSGAK